MAISRVTDWECLQSLGLEVGATHAQAKWAYRQLAMLTHPDRTPSKAAEERFKIISTRYAQLENRFNEGRWSTSWGEPQRPRAGVARAAAPAAATRSSASKNPPQQPAGRFQFEYPTHGKTADIADAFFNSYLTAAAQLARSGEDVKEGADELARGYLRIFSRYKLSNADMQLMQWVYLKKAWASEMPGLFSVLSAASRRAGELVDEQYAKKISSALDVTVSFFRPSGSASTFSMLNQIAMPRAKASSESQKEFHREVAEIFSKNMAPCEAFELRRDREHRAHDNRPFAMRLLRDRPELFGIYGQAGWFDLSHELYGRRKMNAIDRVVAAAIPWAAKARPLWDALGADGCAQLINQAKTPKDGWMASKAMEDRLIESGAYEDLAEKFLTSKMQMNKKARASYERIKSAAKSRLLSFFVARAGKEAEAVFGAAASLSLDELRKALLAAKAAQLGSADLAKGGVDVASFIAWGASFDPGQEAFAAKALLSIREIFGDAPMRKVDAFGRNPREWMTHAAKSMKARSARQRKHPGNRQAPASQARAEPAQASSKSTQSAARF